MSCAVSASITSVIFAIWPCFIMQLDHVDGALRHAVGELLDRDGLGQDDFARELFLGLADVALEPLGAAAEGRDRAGALLLVAGRAGDREAAAALLLGALDGARDDHLRRHAGTANDALGVLVFDRQRPGGRGEARRSRLRENARRRWRGRRRRGKAAGRLAGRRIGQRGRRLAAGQTASCLLLRAALCFRLENAARFLFALARFGGGALLAFARLALFAGLVFDFGALALFDFAFMGARERPGARLALLFGQGSQNDAGRGPRRRPLRAHRLLLRTRRLRRDDRLSRLLRDALARSVRLGSQRAALHLLDDDRLAAPMRKALANDASLDRTLQRQRLRRRDA